MSLILALLQALSTNHEYFDPENSSLQIVRRCVNLKKEPSINICGRYDTATFTDTGIQEFSIELFTWGKF